MSTPPRLPTQAEILAAHRAKMEAAFGPPASPETVEHPPVNTRAVIVHDYGMSGVPLDIDGADVQTITFRGRRITFDLVTGVFDDNGVSGDPVDFRMLFFQGMQRAEAVLGLTGEYPEQVEGPGTPAADPVDVVAPETFKPPSVTETPAPTPEVSGASAQGKTGISGDDDAAEPDETVDFDVAAEIVAAQEEVMRSYDTDADDFAVSTPQEAPTPDPYPPPLSVAEFVEQLNELAGLEHKRLQAMGKAKAHEAVATLLSHVSDWGISDSPLWREAFEKGREAMRRAFPVEKKAERAANQALDDAVSDEPRLSRSLLDIFANPPAPVAFAVDPLIVFRELLLFVGKPFGGKSLFALQLVLHAAAERMFLDTFRFPRPLRLLYVDEEMGLPLILKRLTMMCSSSPAFRDPDLLRRIEIVSRAGLKLDDAKKLDRLRREIGEFPDAPPDIVLFDTFRRLHSAEEKDSGEMAKVMETAIRIGQEFPTAPFLIHHSKKGPGDEDGDWREAARGSGDLVAASQSIAAIWKTGDLAFSFRADVKAAGEIEPFPLLLDPQTLLFRRPSEEEAEKAKEQADASNIEEAKAELCKALRKLTERGGDDFPPSWTKWRDNATGKNGTLMKARLKLQNDKVVWELKRAGKGGGCAYVFPADYEPTMGSQTKPETHDGL